MSKRKYQKVAPQQTNEDAANQVQSDIPQENSICPLCSRPLAGICNRHHLIPLSKGGRGTTTLLLHKICHDKIHSVLTEGELKRYYDTIERIKEHETIAAFIKWVQKKEPEFYDRSVKSADRQSR